jgi:hypothetical protein
MSQEAVSFSTELFQKLQNFHPSAARSFHVTIATQSTTRYPQKHHPKTPLFPKHPLKSQQNSKAPDESGAKLFLQNQTDFRKLFST